MAQVTKSFSSSVDLCTGTTAKTQMSNCFEERLIDYVELGVSGKELRVHLGKFVFTSKNTTSKNNYSVVVSSDCPLIKLHFSLSGNFRHYCEDTNNLVVEVPEGFCNMFFSPSQHGKDEFTGNRNRTLEIYFTKKVLEQIVGNKLVLDLLKKNTLIEPYVYLEKNKKIPLRLKNQINEILNCTYTDSLKKQYLESRLTVLIIDFLIDKTKPAIDKDCVSGSDYDAIVKLEAYCRKNLKKKLTIESLSQMAGFNTTKLKTEFKKVYKTTINKHITLLRMEKARTLIIDENLTIAQVSYEVGYSNPQHFTAAFKKNMGYLPSRLLSGTEE